MTIDIWQTLFLALLQGITELFPISSLGHTVILPPLLGWGALVNDKRFLPLIVALHLGTSIALVLYFWRDWVYVLLNLFTSMSTRRIRRGTPEWESWLIIIGCIPAGVLGLLFEEPLKQLFASPSLVAAVLFLNGSLLFAAERFRQYLKGKRVLFSQTSLPTSRTETLARSTERMMSRAGTVSTLTSYMAAPPISFATQKNQQRQLISLTWKEALVVGLFQALALIPGISRSGITMAGGLAVRLTNEDAARFSFLLGTPLIGAAALLEVPELFSLSQGTLALVAGGMLLSGIAAFLSTKFLMKYFETGSLQPFAYYCWGIGAIALFLFFTVIPIQG